MQEHGRLTAVHISKHSLFRLKITVGCPTYTCPSIRVWCVCVCANVCVLVLVLVCAMVYVLRVCVWDVRFVFWCCGVYVVLWCCVFCWWCGVVRLGMRKTSPCVDSKRLRVCVQDASVCTGKTPACAEHAGVSRYTRRRPERTHGGILNLHTEGFSASSSLLSPLLSSLLSCSLPSLVFSLFPLSNDDNDHSSSRLSLCTHGSVL